MMQEFVADFDLGYWYLPEFPVKLCSKKGRLETCKQPFKFCSKDKRVFENISYIIILLHPNLSPGKQKVFFSSISHKVLLFHFFVCILCKHGFGPLMVMFSSLFFCIYFQHTLLLLFLFFLCITN